MIVALFTYDPVTRELRAVVEHIRSIDDAVANVYWKAKPGERITPGHHLADLEWNSSPDTRVLAPPGCAGVIAFLNHNVLSVGGGLAE